MGLSHTVSGDIASFRTPSRVPIESLKFHFLPKQEGSGDPSPTNVRPITGWTGLNGRQEGKNLIDLNALTGDNKVWWKGSVISGYPNHCVTPKIPVKPGIAYRLNRNSYQQSYVCYFDKNGDYVDQQTWDDYKPSRVIPDNVYFVGITIGTEYLNNPKPLFTVGSQATEYSDYVDPRQIPITFPDGEAIYGGYVDPVAGEIVAEWKSIDLGTKTYSLRSENENRQVWECYCSDIKTTVNGNARSCNAYCSEFSKTTSNGLWSVGKFAPTTSSNNIVIIFVHPASSFANGSECKEAMSGIQLVYELKTPIHIPVTPQDLKAFLDHNNFWSDANDITEVTYAVTESKDMLATRKKAMDFDHAHHKKVTWNQWAPVVTGNNYAPYNSNKISVSIEDGIITQTFLAVESSYRGAVTTPSNMKKHALNRYYYLSYEYCTDFAGKIGGTVGGQYLTNYVKTTQANVWDRFSGVVKRTESGNFDNYVVYLGWFNDSTGIEIGSTCKMRNPIAIDLTQMFGEGNEPTTRAEFELICEINGIDLTIYKPYDTGSNRWLIIP